MEKQELLLIDLDKNKKKHLSLYQSVSEYKKIKDEIKEFEKKEKKLKDIIKDCGYKQIVFKNHNNIETIKIDTIESEISSFDKERAKEILIAQLNEYICDNEKSKSKELIIENIVNNSFDAATTKTTRKQVRIGFKNGK